MGKLQSGAVVRDVDATYCGEKEQEIFLFSCKSLVSLSCEPSLCLELPGLLGLLTCACRVCPALPGAEGALQGTARVLLLGQGVLVHGWWLWSLQSPSVTATGWEARGLSASVA